MKSANEEFCKSRFDDFLKKRSASASVVWQDGDEPPDYYLSLNDVRYAVEVTILMEKLAVGKSEMPRIAVQASLWRFVDDLEQTARARNILHGTYFVHFYEPIEDFGGVKDNMRVKLLDYIESTRDLDEAPRLTAVQDGRQSFIIEKLHNQSDRIHKAGPMPRMKWGGEAATEICNLLEERLAEKHRRLRNVVFPKIALLYDSYHFADHEMYTECVAQLRSVASFHTVFIVQKDSESFILHSQNPDWP